MQKKITIELSVDGLLFQPYCHVADLNSRLEYIVYVYAHKTQNELKLCRNPFMKHEENSS